MSAETPLTETEQEELWRLRAVEIEFRRWKSKAADLQAWNKELQEKLKAEEEQVKINTNRIDILLKTIDERSERIAQLEEDTKELSFLRSKVTLMEDHAFKVMDFKIVNQHWVLDNDHAMYPPGYLIPVTMEYK